jgi:hypothetical protein
LLSLGLIVSGVGGIAAGCAQAPLGPPFRAEPEPVAPRARLYLYRPEGRSDFSRVRVTVDGLEIGEFRSGEYDTLELSSGSHHLRAGVRNVAFVAWGWNDQRLRFDPGETLYVEVSVRLTERAQPAAAGLEIAGRTGGVVSENVYLQLKPEAEALEALRAMTRRTR